MRVAGHKHSDRDKIYTPPELAKRLIAKIPSIPSDTWCDPCFGKGSFFSNFPECKDKNYCEIDSGTDFLKHEQKYDWLVTNIPFSQPKEFIFKMAELCVKGFGILCLANSMTATRIQKLAEMGIYMNHMTVVYVKEWGFGYRTDFYVFTRGRIQQFDVRIAHTPKP